MTQNTLGHQVQEFANGVRLLMQQEQSALRPYVESGTHEGNAASPIDQFGRFEMQSVTGRLEPIVDQDVAVDRRWVYPQDKAGATIIDKFDTLRLKLDPRGPMAEAVKAGCNRVIDDVIIAGMFGTAQTGVAGATSVAFPAANQVSVNEGGTNSGLNIAKLLRVKRSMGANFIQADETRYIAVSEAQIQDLMKEPQFTSGDFNPARPLADGKVTSFYGFTFIPCERLPLNGSSQRRVPVWIKRGLHLGIWSDVRIDMSELKTIKGLPWQIYADMTIGATRTEENCVYEIPCVESA